MNEENLFFGILSELVGYQVPKKAHLLKKNPFREDKHPSFAVYRWQGKWFFKDFATGTCGTVYHLIKERYGEAQARLYNKSETTGEKSDNIEFETSAFSFQGKEKEAEYFLEIGIRKEILEINSVKEHEWIEFRNKKYYASKEQPILSYTIPSINKGTSVSQKIYMPKREVRFFGNRRWHHIFGTISLLYFNKEKNLYIGAGEKDTLVLQNYFNAPAICLTSETSVPNNYTIKFIKSFEKRIVIVYDNDTTGEKMSDKLCSLLEKNGLTVENKKINSKYKDVTEQYMAEKKIVFIN